MAKAGAKEFRHHTKLTEYPVSASVTHVTAATTDTVPLTHPIVFVNSAAGAVTTYTLPNGVPGEGITIISANANDIDIIPTTSTIFASIALDVVGDTAILMYVDDTTGWKIESLMSVAVDSSPAYAVA